jgi:hypothetical protein
MTTERRHHEAVTTAVQLMPLIPAAVLAVRVWLARRGQ